MAHCKECGASESSADFYASIKTYCKQHWRDRVKANREANIDHYREFDRQRGMRADRVAMREAYRRTESGRVAVARAHRSYMDRHPDRHTARIALNNAVRDGRVTPWPACSHPEGCDSTRVEAHHADYSRPLDVVWLCNTHHRQSHALFTRLLSHDHQ